VSDTLTARPPLAGIAIPGRYGAATGTPGVTLRERTGLGIAAVMARKGKAGTFRAAAEAVYGIVPPDAPRYVAGSEIGFIGTGPGQWLAVSSAFGGGRLALDLAARLTGLASISDQGDGRAVIRIAGPKARETLAKGLAIDLHPSAFTPGSSATSVISLMGVTLWQVDAMPTYDLMVFRSLAGSFWTWLTHSAAEFGYDVATAAD
jgi:methylglutamate dehydrogenase subunit D